MNKRIMQFLSAENITQSQLADTLGVARASVSHIIAGRNKPSFEFIESMARSFPAVNLEWLVTGKGRMYKDAYNDDLFANSEDSPAASQQMPDIRTQTNLMDQNISTTPENNCTDTASKRISKIIVFYDDSSFFELK